jgi:hypothetical protein
LDKEFNAIFRRAFASRVFPPEIVEQLGMWKEFFCSFKFAYSLSMSYLKHSILQEAVENITERCAIVSKVHS